MRKITFIIEVEDILVPYVTSKEILSFDPYINSQAQLMMSGFKSNIERDNPGCTVYISYKPSDRYNPKSNYYYVDAITTVLPPEEVQANEPSKLHRFVYDNRDSVEMFITYAVGMFVPVSCLIFVVFAVNSAELPTTPETIQIHQHQ